MNPLKKMNSILNKQACAPGMEKRVFAVDYLDENGFFRNTASGGIAVSNTPDWVIIGEIVRSATFQGYAVYNILEVYNGLADVDIANVNDPDEIIKNVRLVFFDPEIEKRGRYATLA